MSEDAENRGDEHDVVGEPVSEPNQGAVVGEPPEETAPVLGEPVPLANGAQTDPKLVSLPSAEKSTTNGIHKDAISTAQFLVGSNPSAAEEPSSLEEVSAQDQSVTENPVPSEPGTEVSDAHTRYINEPQPDTEFPSDVVITHISDTPTLPSAESETLSIENPYLVLEDDLREFPEDVAKEESDATDWLLDDAPSPSDFEEASAASVPSVRNKEVTESSAVGTDSQREIPNEHLISSTDGSEGISATDLNDSNEVNAVEQKELEFPSQNEKAKENSKVGAKEEKLVTTEAAPEIYSIAVGKVLNGVEQDASKQEELPEDAPNDEVSCGKNEDYIGIPGKDSSEQVEQVVDKEAIAQPEVFSNEKSSAKEGQDHGQSSIALSSEAWSTNSSESRAISFGEFSTKHKPADEVPFGGNGSVHDQDDIPRDQGGRKDGSKGAEEMEKPTSFLKPPLVFTTLLIAVAGVAVALISRSRR